MCHPLKILRMKLLGCLGLILFGGILFIAIFLKGLYDFILTALGLNPSSVRTAGRHHRSQEGSSSHRGTSSQQNNTSAHGHTGQQKEKIFQKSDNEYVDFVDLP